MQVQRFFYSAYKPYWSEVHMVAFIVTVMLTGEAMPQKPQGFYMSSAQCEDLRTDKAFVMKLERNLYARYGSGMSARYDCVMLPPAPTK